VSLLHHRPGNLLFGQTPRLELLVETRFRVDY